MISHIDNINRNLAMLLNKYDEEVVMSRSGLKWDAVVALCTTNESTRLKRLEKLALSLDTTVAELTLMPGIDTAWYKEARAEYIGLNLKCCRCELKESFSGLASGIDCDDVKRVASRLWNYESGQALPSLGMLQAIADVLEMEVADLMLPIELKLPEVGW